MSTAVLRALRALLPGTDESLLLQACLADGDACADAWNRFMRSGHDLVEMFRTDRGGRRRLGPLLEWNLRRNEIAVDPALLTVLRTGALREELRSRLFREIVAEAIDALTGTNVDFVALGGVDLGMSAYPNPVLRHTHDIDLLLHESDIAQSADALRRVGFLRAPDEEGVRILKHRRDLPVRLNTALFHLSCHEGGFDDVAGTSRRQDVGGRMARVLSREDAMAAALGRPCYSTRRANLQWACDAWMVASRGPLHADSLIAALTRARLLLPASVLLRYVSDLGAPVQALVLERVEAAAKKSTPLDRDLALHGLRHGTIDGWRAVLARMPDRTTRLQALRWIALPSPKYVSWAHDVEHVGMVPWYYAHRVVKRRWVRFARGGGVARFPSP